MLPSEAPGKGRPHPGSHTSPHSRGPVTEPQVSGTSPQLRFFELLSNCVYPHSLGGLGETQIAGPHP